VLFADHVINQMPMLSGAGQCDLICHLFQQSSSMVPKSMRNVAFHQPWLAASKLRVEYSGKEEKSFVVKNAIGNTVVQAVVSGMTAARIPERLVIETAKARMPIRINSDALYAVFNDIGVNYGAYHRGVRELYASSTESLARIDVAAGAAGHARNGYYLHAGVLDAAFQTAAGVLLARAAEDNCGEVALPLMVPLGIDAIHLYKYLQDAAYYAHVTPYAETMIVDDVMACNVDIYDMLGNPVISVVKLQMRRLPQQANTTPAPRRLDSVLATVTAEPPRFFAHGWSALPDIDPATTALSGSSWLLLGAPDASEYALAEQLSALGINCMLVPYEHYAQADIDALRQLFSRINAIDGILFFGDVELHVEQGSRDATGDMSTMQRLFNLFKAISAHGRENAQFKRLRVVRVARQLFEHAATVLDSRRALATGFLRSARVEFPLLDVRQLDLGDVTPDKAAAAVVAEMRAPGTVLDDGPEILCYQGHRLSQDIVPMQLTASRNREAVFNAAKTFWIIGGTSGVGRLLSYHLASHYQSRLVISGSRQLPDITEYDTYLEQHDAEDAIAATIRQLRKLEAMGAQVRYVRMDVRSADAIRVALDTIRASALTLNGVYFSALQLDDRMIVQKDWPGYRNMMDMRVFGLRELIRQTQDYELDFFVMFSSVAGLIGNLGQSDYSATDAYMDALPYELCRAQGGQRYRSIQWGAWSLGQQVSDTVLDHLKRNGMTHVTPEPGMAALEEFLLSDRISAAFVPGTESAAKLAHNLFHLRQGSATRSKSRAAKSDPALQKNATQQTQAIPNPPVQQAAANTASAGENHTMSNPHNRPMAEINSSQMQMLLEEFERQRDMFLRLCENQNALLSGSLDNLQSAPVQYAVSAPDAPAPQRMAPVAVAHMGYRVETPAPVQQTAAPQPAPQPVAPPPVPVAAAPVVAAAKQGRPENLHDYIAALMARTLNIEVSEIDPDQNIMELGADSMTAMSLVKEVETTYNIELPATLLFEYSTMNELVEYLKTEIE
jgi:acyl carrier protein/NAD(P)-dependent dehydrogenase (short-subunit alcohol dehydrogenase family)